MIAKNDDVIYEQPLMTNISMRIPHGNANMKNLIPGMPVSFPLARVSDVSQVTEKSQNLLDEKQAL